jgi:NADH dehydrogenase [ubiquinone] 1 alpha subcomplex assembly factor 6
MSEPAQNLIDDARKLDPDRTLAVAFAAPADRPLLTALVLFNAELARIPEVVKEPLAGMIRYQWWRDALARAARGEGRSLHPLLPPVVAAITGGRLRTAPLLALIDAREGELDRLQPADLEALEAYAATTAGGLHALMAEVSGADARTIAAASRVGIAYALVGVLRAIGFHRAQGRILLPADLVEREAIDAADILAARNEAALARVFDAILTRARVHLAAAAAAGPFERRVLPALLPARLAAAQATKLARLGPRATMSPMRDAWTVPDLLWRWLIRRL